MKKKISRVLSVMLVLLITTLIVAVTASATTEFTEGYYTYVVENNQATITDVSEKISGDVTVPATLGGYRVIEIESLAFKDCDKIKNLTIPEGVEIVRVDYCEKLETINLPSTMRLNNKNPLGYKCHNLKSITVHPDNKYYKSVDGVLFKFDVDFGDTIVKYPAAKSGTEYSIPEGVTTIRGSAFENAVNLKSVVLPESAIFIEYDAFSGCTGLTEIYIPENVSGIEYSAFNNCDKLESITVAENNDYFRNDSFGVLYNKNMTAIIKCPDAAELTEYEIPASVTKIGEYAFYSNNNLKRITLSESVSVIERLAFGYCEALTEVEISGMKETFGDGAFYYCGSLEKVIIADGVAVVGDNAFSGCEKLSDVILAEGITEIGSGAFGECSSLEGIILPESLTLIGFSAFNECDSLVNITIPAGVTEIEAATFGNCSSLESIVLPESLAAIGGHAFYGCSSLDEITIPESVTKIGNNAFFVNTVFYAADEAAWNAIDKAVDSIRYQNIYFNHPTHIYAEKIMAPTCIEGGYTINTCHCGDEYIDSYIDVNPVAHMDADGDEYCDWCDDFLGTEDEENNCSHMCHKSGFMGFIWKIINFFQKLFGINPVCECGKAHY